MAIALDGNGGNGIAFIVSAGIVYEIIAMCCSSPQTAEINIRKREETLMKWVHVGQVQAGAFIGIAALVDKKRRAAILGGGVLAMVVAEGMYMHARSAGLANPGPETETY